jgi:uncharacterized protein YndB with AHSA1/START domain
MSKDETSGTLKSFKLAQEVTLAAPIEHVWKSLTGGIDSWWRFRQGGDESKVTLDARIGGEFAERWGDGSGALWGIVMYVDRPKVLRLAGPLGMHTANSNHYSYELESTDTGGTLLKLTHHGVGDVDSKVESDYGDGWGKLLGTYLKAYAEEGKDWGAVDSE